MFVEQPMWNAMSSWFTPTTLFLLLNFMIATIFLTSGFTSNKALTKSDLHHHENQSQSQSQSQQTEPVLLQRSPSVLQRLKSINFHQYTYYYKPEPTQAASFQVAEYQNEPDPSLTTSFDADEYENDTDPSRTMSFDADEYEAEDRFDFDHFEEKDRSIEEVFSDLRVEKGSNFVRTKSDTEPASGAVPVKLVKKMKKSASSKSAFKHFSEAEVLEARRPATAREVKTVVEGAEDDEEVDLKADDFINKFKQQLKLQRLDSILRYKEMLGRGAGK